jgi:hypothetical protein
MKKIFLLSIIAMCIGFSSYAQSANNGYSSGTTKKSSNQTNTSSASKNNNEATSFSDKNTTASGNTHSKADGSESSKRKYSYGAKKAKTNTVSQNVNRSQQQKLDNVKSNAKAQRSAIRNNNMSDAQKQGQLNNVKNQQKQQRSGITASGKKGKTRAVRQQRKHMGSGPAVQ